MVPMKLLARLNIPWYYVTRLLGVAMLVYGMVLDHTGERGTIILGALGLIGLEKVARTDSPE